MQKSHIILFLNILDDSLSSDNAIVVRIYLKHCIETINRISVEKIFEILNLKRVINYNSRLKNIPIHYMSNIIEHLLTSDTGRNYSSNSVQNNVYILNFKRKSREKDAVIQK